jgi:hypothetical protein
MVSRPATPESIAHHSCPGAVAPAVDAYFAASSVGTGLLALGLGAEDDGSGGDAFRAAGALSLVAGALFTASAIHGFKQRRACNELKLAVGPPLPAEPSSTRPVPYGVAAPVIVVPAPEPTVVEHVEETETVETRTTTRTTTRVLE